MQQFTTTDWLTIIGIFVAVVGVVVALIIGIIQIKRKNDSISIIQGQGAFSKGKQKIKITKDK
ncbi:hypothetical protein C1S86_10620 [Vibrio parahaemolyticus]|uniref:hypothetical protein n=1 Tax=Vibrio TaxID=662 RepID=UPI000993A187|nr:MULTISPECIES: hypothetical protein [Vibrio]EJG1643657.1 hypothetical protein [Vibrio parahaemolyticus]ELA6985233.1 hypothetical protein [Vibrio parahaemolyticus]ELA9712066.1 hypothetical protein [Vibrio parahaemolyticus]ELA9726088.1 hypothetical protein [Vibrio parahaemolyticus]MBE4054060.1 hypothetical protein [Vibrio parahaemolyticus]